MTIRDISVLYSMDSYQDMSDEEIDALLDYKIKLAVSEGINNYVATHPTNTPAVEEALNVYSNMLDTIYNHIKNNPPALEVISLE